MQDAARARTTTRDGEDWTRTGRGLDEDGDANNDDNDDHNDDKDDGTRTKTSRTAEGRRGGHGDLDLGGGGGGAAADPRGTGKKAARARETDGLDGCACVRSDVGRGCR